MVGKAGKVSALMSVWQTPMHPSKPSSVATCSWRHLPIAPTSDPVKAPSASSASFTVTLEAGQAVFLVGGRVEKEGSMTSLKPQSPQLKQASPFLVLKSEGGNRNVLSKPASLPRGLQTDTPELQRSWPWTSYPFCNLCLSVCPPPLPS